MFFGSRITHTQLTNVALARLQAFRIYGASSLASQPYFPHARKILRGREERKNTSGNSCQVFVSLPENEVVQSGESSHVIIVYLRDRHVTLRHIQSTCINFCF